MDIINEQDKNSLTFKFVIYVPAITYEYTGVIENIYYFAYDVLFLSYINPV